MKPGLLAFGVSHSFAGLEPLEEVIVRYTHLFITLSLAVGVVLILLRLIKIVLLFLLHSSTVLLLKEDVAVKSVHCFVHVLLRLSALLLCRWHWNSLFIRILFILPPWIK